jgi:hypothetical protein
MTALIARGAARLTKGTAMAHIDNLTLEVRDNGVFLIFSTQNGATTALDVNWLASREEGEVRDVMLAWCRDRRANVQPQGAPEQPHRLLAQDYTD